jgi:hypothetical protein
MVALQNIENNEVPCKIVLDKELQAFLDLFQQLPAERWTDLDERLPESLCDEAKKSSASTCGAEGTTIKSYKYPTLYVSFRSVTMGCVSAERPCPPEARET